MHTKKTEITFEGLESTHNLKELLKLRYNTLKPKSVGAKHEGNGWTVTFDYVKGNEKTGRAVTMTLSGNNIKMEHQDIMLDYFTAKNVIVDSKVKFGRYEEFAYDEDDTKVSFYSVEFMLKITNKSEKPVPTLIVDNRSKYVSFLINGKEDNPLSLYNGLTATDATQYLQKNEIDSFTVNWILTPDCGLTKKYGNKFTVQWKYMNFLSQITEVDIEHHTSKIKPLSR